MIITLHRSYILRHYHVTRRHVSHQSLESFSRQASQTGLIFVRFSPRFRSVSVDHHLRSVMGKLFFVSIIFLLGTSVKNKGKHVNCGSTPDP